LVNRANRVDDHRDPHRRRNHLPARHAAGEGRGQLLLALQPGEGDQGPDEQADGQDHRKQLRQGQQGQFDHNQNALPAFDDDLQLIQALRQQADSRQGAARRRDGQGDLAEKIALNQGHAAAGEHPGCGRA
jgi:hypothetical protein